MEARQWWHSLWANVSHEFKEGDNFWANTDKVKTRSYGDFSLLIMAERWKWAVGLLLSLRG